MKKIINISIAILILFVSQHSYATIITHGNLVTDDLTNYITDITTQRMYTRFDAFNLSYADTLAAVGSGGAFEGWSISTTTIADEFVNAALGGVINPPCSSTSFTVCGTLNNWLEGQFGTSYQNIFAYLSGDAINPIGLMRINYDGSIEDLDNWETGVVDGFFPINLLLYKDSITVSEPATLILLILGLMIGWSFAHRRQTKLVR